MSRYKELFIKSAEELTESSHKRKLKGSCAVLSKKEFDTWRDEHEAHIVGNIRKRHLRFKEKSGRQKLREKKIAKAVLCEGDDEKYYDVKENRSAHTYGYAWIGGDDFLRVTTLNPLFIVLAILLAAIIIGASFFVPRYMSIKALPVEGEKIIEEVKESGYKVLYVDINGYDGSEIKLSPKHRTLELLHLDTENNKNFLLAYKIYNGDELIFQTYNEKTKQVSLIKAGYSIQADVYDKLPLGRSKLKYEITAYTADKFQKGNTFYQTVSVIKTN